MNTQQLNGSLRFAFIGDLFLGGEFIPYAQQNKMGFLQPFQNITKYLNDCDILLINLESPIFQGPDKRSDVTAILSNHPAVMDFLTSHKLCILNLANNHIMDYGVAGLRHTISLLQKNNLNYVGAGNNEEEANRECIIECKGRRISFVAYTSNERNVRAIIARSDSPGCATFLDLDRAVRQVRALKQKTDVVCVSLHWGNEYFQYPSPAQIETAHILADAGATFVIGHHPHVIQGIEKYKNSLIMYSLGNFFFPPFRSTTGRRQYQKPLTRDFIIVRSAFNESETIGYDLCGGAVNKDYCLVPFVGNYLKQFTQKVSSLSTPVNLPGYDKFWESYKVRRQQELLNENLFEAFKKLFRMSLKDIASTIGPKDIKRNIIRLYKIIFRPR